jgi:hypothetical protein
MADDNFLSRWSRRKEQARRGEDAADVPRPAQAITPPAPIARVEPDRAAATQPAESDADRRAVAPSDAKPVQPPAPAAPTLDDVARLTRDSDYSRFVAPGVDPGVRNAALKKLFSDPQFNVMDGLDVYIDDYGKPSPIPASVLRRMVQAQALGLFDRETQASPPGQGEHALPAATAQLDNPPGAPPDEPQPDEDPDLRLQPHDAAGPADDGEPAAGPGEDAGRER